MEIDKQEIFKLIKTHKFDEIYKLIKTQQIKNLDFRDINYNYFIQYIINYNQINILELILNLSKKEIINIRLDILDTDGRSILYNCIKYNYIEMLKQIILYNETNIGISVIDIKDKLGLTSLHYAVIFNNFECFKILLENKANPYIVSKDGNNVFVTALMYKRNNMIEYLLEKKYNLNFVTSVGETLIQVAANYQNNEIIQKLLETNINFNNTTSDYGISILHQFIILNNFSFFQKILKKNIDINLPDFFGNTPLHYIFIDKRIDFLEDFFKHDIKFNISNINGELPLHILLDSDIDIDSIDNKILDKIILETDLNYQNNKGETCLMKIVRNNLIKKFYDLLVIKPLNFYIEDINYEHIKITDDIMNLMVESYYNQIKLNPESLVIDWEIWCSKDNYEKLKPIFEGKNSVEICKNKIKNIIIKEKRTLPKIGNMQLKIDSGIFTNFCYYTGSPIDILFGLLLLYQDFKNQDLRIILDYPLTINNNLETYYKNLGIDYPYKLDFSNVEILWSYQKIFFPSFFDDEINKQIKKAKYIVIPIGIETSIGSHANILFWDVNNKTIERFEPNGANYPTGYNYNPILLDNLLENKFKNFDNDIKYLSPNQFLPTIGFQILENLESVKCKKIGDPNGFCAVWCSWWVYQRLLNINNPKLNINNIADELIKQIKFDNQSFKTIIRNFSKKITEIRDSYLKKYNLDINDWIVGNYTEENLNNLEKDIIKLL